MGRIENKDICSECGGKCCKECGCSYAPSDFKDELTFEKVMEKIASGTTSICAIFAWSHEGHMKTLHPILLLKERDIGKGDIDLISIPTGCGSLTDTGCPYDLSSRPLGGACLIPNESHNCPKSVSTKELARMWQPYKGIMIKALQLIGNDSATNILLGQIEQFLFDVRVAAFESREIPEQILAFSKELESNCIEQNAVAAYRFTEYLSHKHEYVKSIYSNFGD